jgi:hypothetical protein
MKDCVREGGGDITEVEEVPTKVAEEKLAHSEEEPCRAERSGLASNSELPMVTKIRGSVAHFISFYFVSLYSIKSGREGVWFKGLGAGNQQRLVRMLQFRHYPKHLTT